MGRKSSHCGSWIRITNRQTGASTKAQVQGMSTTLILADAHVANMLGGQTPVQAVAMVVWICLQLPSMILHPEVKV